MMVRKLKTDNISELEKYLINTNERLSKKVKKKFALQFDVTEYQITVSK